MVPAAPKPTNWMPAVQGSSPRSLPFANPRLSRVAPENRSTKGQGWPVLPSTHQVKMQGDRAIIPVVRKAKKVAIPHLTDISLSSTLTSPNSHIIIVSVKTCLLVEISSTNLQASAQEYPFSTQIVSIYRIYSFSRCQTQYISRAYWAAMKDISLFEEMQSPRAMSKAPTTVAENTRANSLSTGAFAEQPVSRITVALMTPSIPPIDNRFQKRSSGNMGLLVVAHWVCQLARGTKLEQLYLHVRV